MPDDDVTDEYELTRASPRHHSHKHEHKREHKRSKRSRSKERPRQPNSGRSSQHRAASEELEDGEIEDGEINAAGDGEADPAAAGVQQLRSAMDEHRLSAAGAAVGDLKQRHTEQSDGSRPAGNGSSKHRWVRPAGRSQQYQQ